MKKGRTNYCWSVVLVLALCALAPASVIAQTGAIQIFVKVDGIPGESHHDRHKDWIDAFSYGDGVSQGYNPAYSAGASSAAMRADFAPVTIVKQLDKASPKLREASAMGKHIKLVTIEMLDAAGDQIKFLEVRLEDVMIASVQAVMPDLTSMPALTAASSVGIWVLQEKVSFVYGRIRWTYTIPKRPDGSGGGNVVGGWDLQKNKVW